jgi:alpha-mannosidase
LGYKTYFLRRKPTPPAAIPPEKSAAKAETIFENDRYLLEIDLTTGGIKRLFNKKQKKELIDGFHQGNIFRLYTEQEHDMSAWSIGRIDSVKNLLKNTKIIRTVKGPVMDIIETECIFGKSRISQEIIFFKAQDKIEFRTRLSWYETGTPETGIPLLRVSFPLGIISAKAVYEIPFGAIERPNNGQEAPALKWLDYSQGKFGIALLNNAKYGHNVQGNKVELTLIRSPYFPDLNPDSGEHTFSYCLCPHEGNWQDADIVKRGYELNMPLIPVVIDKLNTGCDDKILPPEKAFVKAGAKNIIISCLKKAEDGKGLILHAYESQGRVSKGRLDFGLDINIAAETDLIEKTLSSVGLAENKIEYEFAKWEIKAYRLVPGEKG